jgi:hypothetical protein
MSSCAREWSDRDLREGSALLGELEFGAEILDRCQATRLTDLRLGKEISEPVEEEVAASFAVGRSGRD